MENRGVMIFVYRNVSGNVEDLLKSVRISAYMMLEERAITNPCAHFITNDYWYLVPIKKCNEKDLWERLVMVYDELVSEAVCVYWTVEESDKIKLEEYIFYRGEWKKYVKIPGERQKPAKLDIPENINREFKRIYNEHLNYIQ